MRTQFSRAVLLFLGVVSLHGALARAVVPAQGAGPAGPDLAEAGEQAEIPGLLRRIDQLLASPATRIRTEPARWSELEDFHAELWRALALDPIQGISADERQSEALTLSLESKLAHLIASPLVARFGAREEFTEYASKCQELIELRKKRFYREARGYARTGGLDRLYARLTARISAGGEKEGGDDVQLSVILPADLDSQLREAIERIHQATGALTAAPGSASSGTEPGSSAAGATPSSGTFVRTGAIRAIDGHSIHGADHGAPSLSSSANAPRISTEVTALLVANLLWIFVSISAFFTGRKMAGKSYGSDAGPAPARRPISGCDWFSRHERALERKRQGELRDQELLRKLNGLSWTFSRFFVKYHLEEPLSNVDRFRQELQELSEALKDLVAQTQDCVTAGERGLVEVIEQLRELAEPVEVPSANPASKGESFAA